MSSTRNRETNTQRSPAGFYLVLSRAACLTGHWLRGIYGRLRAQPGPRAGTTGSRLLPGRVATRRGKEGGVLLRPGRPGTWGLVMRWGRQGLPPGSPPSPLRSGSSRAPAAQTVLCHQGGGELGGPSFTSDSRRDIGIWSIWKRARIPKMLEKSGRPSSEGAGWVAGSSMGPQSRPRVHQAAGRGQERGY